MRRVGSRTPFRVAVLFRSHHEPHPLSAKPEELRRKLATTNPIESCLSQITMAKQSGVPGRGAFYDRTGAIRDVFLARKSRLNPRSTPAKSHYRTTVRLPR